MTKCPHDLFTSELCAKTNILFQDDRSQTGIFSLHLFLHDAGCNLHDQNMKDPGYTQHKPVLGPSSK